MKAWMLGLICATLIVFSITSRAAQGNENADKILENCLKSNKTLSQKRACMERCLKVLSSGDDMTLKLRGMVVDFESGLLKSLYEQAEINLKTENSTTSLETLRRLISSQTTFEAHNEESCSFEGAAFLNGTGEKSAILGCKIKLLQDRQDQVKMVVGIE